MIAPVWMIFASSTHTSSIINMNGLQLFLGDSFYENYLRVLLYQGGFFKEITALKMFFNSFIMATGVAILSVVTSLMAAYALVYYRIKHATLLFWIIFITILVPLECSDRTYDTCSRIIDTIYLCPSRLSLNMDFFTHDDC